MVIQKADQVRIKCLVTEAISNLCRNGLNFRSEFCIEGLLGITLDNDDIFLINIKETITSDKISAVSAAEKELCDLTIPSSLGCSVTDAGLLMAASTINSTLDFSKTGLLGEKVDKQDAFQDLNIASGYTNSDLEMLFDLSIPGRKRDLLPMDMSISFLGQDNDVDQLINKSESSKDDTGEDDDEITEASDLVLVKEEGRLDTIGLAHSAVSMKPEFQLMSLDLTSGTGHGDEAMLLNLKVDEQLAAATLEAADLLPLNLSDPQDPQPQDLSTNQANKQKIKPVCGVCGRKFRSEGGLQKHRDKEHPGIIDEASGEETGAVALVKETPQPLDLTIARGENDGDLEHELNITEQQPFTCICSKVITDYETYIDHVTNCSKSRLTPCKSCEICGKYFFSNCGYVKHKRLHVGAYRFRCNICHKGFFDRTHLSAHMDSSHNKVRRYECDYCNKSFFWKHHLKRHKITCDKSKELLSLTNDQPSSDLNDFSVETIKHEAHTMKEDKPKKKKVPTATLR